MALKRKVLIAFTIFILLTISVLSFFPFIYKNQIKNEVLSFANSEINGDVSFSEVNLSFYHQFPNFSLEVNDLLIRGTGVFEKDTLLFAKQLSLCLDLKTYLKNNEIHINRIILNRPIVNLVINSDTLKNFNILKSNADSDTSSSNKNLFIDIDRLSIENGSIQYKDYLNDIFFEVKGFEHLASWEVNKKIFDWKTHTLSKSFSFDYEGIRYLDKKETELDLKVEVDLEKSKLTLKENNIRINHFNLGIVGSMGFDSNQYAFDLVFNAKQTVFKHILSLMPGILMDDLSRIQTDGQVAFDGFVKGTFNDSLNIWPKFYLSMQVKNAMFKYDSLPKPIENIGFHLIAKNTDGVIQNTVFDFKSIKLKIDQNILLGYLKINGLSNPKINGDLKALVDLTDLKNIFPLQQMTIAGLANADIKLNGIYNAKSMIFPKIDAKLRILNGYFKSDNFPESLDSLDLNMEIINETGQFKDSQAKIKNLSFSIDKEPFVLSGEVSDFEDFGYDLNLKGKVDLEKISKLYSFEGVSLQGVVKMDLETKGNLKDLESKNYSKVSAKGMLKINDFKASIQNSNLSFCIKESFLAFTPSRILLAYLKGSIGKSDFSMKGELSNYLAFLTHSNDLITAKLHLNADTFYLNEWMSNNNSNSVDDTVRKFKIIEVPKYLDFTFDSEIKNVFYDDMHITNLEGEIKVIEGVLSLNETGFNSLGAKFSLTGDYNTVNYQRPFIDFDLRIQELDINKAYREVALVRKFAPVAQETFGTLSINYKFKSDLTDDVKLKYETMEGEGRLRIHEAKFKDMKIIDVINSQSKRKTIQDPSLKDFVIDTEIHGEKLVIKPCILKINDFEADVKGVSFLNGSIDYYMKVSLLPFEKIKLPFHITGTYSKPIITLSKGKSI